MEVLFSLKEMIRGAKYALVGVSTFTVDIIILFILVEFFSFPEYIAAAIGFIIGASINYLLSRTFVFTGTKRKLSSGYVLFILFGTVTVSVISGSMYLLVTVLRYNYLVSRIAIGGILGIGNYLANYFINFKVQDI